MLSRACVFRFLYKQNRISVHSKITANHSDRDFQDGIKSSYTKQKHVAIRDLDLNDKKLSDI